MKTSKNRTKKKDWQKVDARILGQILAAQNIDFVLPDSTHIAEFFAETLIAIPGIKACRVCLREVSVQKGEMEVEVCESCEASREKPGSNEDTSSFEPGFKCGLVGQPDVQFSTIASPFHHFGFFIFQVDDLDTFNLYKPFIDNLANYVALSLENHQQKDLLQKARDQLEFRVAERTEELRASNDAIKDLYNNAPCGYHSLDKDGFFILINDTELRWLEYSRDEIVGKVTFRSLLSKNSQKTFDANFSGFKERGWVSDLEFEMVRKDGSILPVLLNATTITDHNGNYVMSRSTIFDITERKRAEEALHQSKERFRSFVEQANDIVYTVSPDGIFTYVSPNWKEMLGHETSEVAGKSFEIFVHPDDLAACCAILNQTIVSGKKQSGFEYRVKHKNGSWQWHTLNASVIRDGDGRIVSFLGIARNITERKQAEQALRENEEKFRTLIEQSAEGVMLADEDGNIVEWNQAYERITGLEQSQVLGKPVWDMMIKIIAPERATGERIESIKADILESLRTGKSPLFAAPSELEFYPVWSREKHYLQQTIFPIKTEKGYRLASLIEDITERKQAEVTRQAHVRFLESMDRVNRAIQGTNDLEQMMSDVLDIVLSVFDCDRVFLIYPCDPDALSWYAPMERTRPEYPGILALGKDEVPMDAEVARTLRILLKVDGPVKFGLGSSNSLPSDVSERFDIKSFMSMALYPKVGKPWQFGIHQCSYERIWTQEDERLLQEIGRRLSDALSSLLAYRNLQESEERYRQLVDISPDAIVVYGQGRIVFVNPAAVRLAGAKSAEDLIGRSVLEFIQPDYSENVNKEIEHILRTGESGLFVRENILRVDGTKLDVEVAIVPYQFQGEYHIQILARDITERKQHEREREAIIAVSAALRHATTRTEILNVILDRLIDLFDSDGAILVLPDPQTGGFIDEMGRGIVGERMIGLNIPPGAGVCNWVVTNKKPYLNNHAEKDPFFYRPDLLGDSHCLASVPLITQDQIIGALWIARKVDILEQDLRLLNAIADIAANAIRRVMLYEQTEQQLHHLLALHQIDIAITNNVDTNATLDVLLNNVKNELEADAASILLLDPVTHTLDYAAGIGFRTRGIEQSHVKLGDGCAGRAAQEIRTVSCLDIGQPDGAFVRSSLLAGEEFVLHYATPLVVKGQVKGVLELFHRKTFEPEMEWLDYFETLATQAAIAIENASLFENLQRSNAELTLAYDATIEGWSRALDLRDRETEGHTQRVAEMALKLAERMGMSSTEKQDLWRGSLLHDIGKMGVPDSILLKPGPLTDGEREIMQQHPLYAYQMLSPISYLKHALEISYCHHEKWDGSGYPRGLKGDEIPLSARVFAVVDVYDALTSDRPYRKAWSDEKVYHYIEEQAGKHFDPQVVKIFLESRSR